MKNTLDLNLVEEFSNLEYFVVKAPVSSQEFWKEWQEKYSRAFISRIAVKKLLKTRKLGYEEIKRYRALLEVYEEVVFYLENLKKLALNLRGVFEVNESPEFDDEDIDFDL
ncbi:MAG: hypothetical protein N2648_03745 [Aquificaceae bacterium]|nr:hypothetical protein [Aquificaceae bacterium]MCS7196343.1 hypothetical protein [Aquificaceae bacterium]MCX7989738.1 hypothetical protein [Aquificaceae bacterium]MDW8032016.1 hypothetical protein [Aquificaceae bacterium]MDW8294629.1 hypothetical protein [Aquificaceae bacterium]